jgi:DNA-binding LacI/PurR family transcriptional regulator
MNGDETKLNGSKRVTLKSLADHLGLTAGTVSAVLNQSSAAQRIPQSTKDRIFAAAREFNYQPNALARALRAGQLSTRDGDPANSRGAIVIVGADQHLGRAIHALQQAGLRVPDDLTLLGVDGVPLAALNYSLASAGPSPT